MHPLIRLAAFINVALIASLAPAWSQYPLSRESRERLDGVPRGDVTAFTFSASKVFPKTSRACWLYVPAQYDGSEPAALMVFQDGHAYVGDSGQMRVPIVFDNLISQGAMPPTVGLFINPGHQGEAKAADDSWGTRSNRSVEYDTPSDAYARFLIEELIPHITKTYQVHLRPEPQWRAICGMSSGGICAWTVAWERPNAFGKVLSHIGSFVNIRGGHVYPALIRKTERKPLRVFLQDGINDLNNAHGNWPLGNRQMASALAFAGYDHRFIMGVGAHNGEHGGAILPDSLRWLWRDWKLASQAPNPPEKKDVAWQRLPGDYQFTDGIISLSEETLLFSDLRAGRLYHSQAGAAFPTPWLDDGLRVSGLDRAPDGTVYAAVQGTGEKDTSKRIVAISPTDKEVGTLATRVEPNDLVVSHSGHAFFTDTRGGTLHRVPTSARNMSRPPVVAGGIDRPNGIALSPDHSHLYVSEHGGPHIWRFALSEEGDLRGGERWATMALDADRGSGGDGMCVAPDGQVFVTSYRGIQVFDTSGQLTHLLSAPEDRSIVSVALTQTWLYVCSGERVYRTTLDSLL